MSEITQNVLQKVALDAEQISLMLERTVQHSLEAIGDGDLLNELEAAQQNLRKLKVLAKVKAATGAS